MIGNRILKLFILVTLIGVADALYLTVDYYWGTGVECIVTKGCEVVLNSEFSVIAGIPVSLFGLIFYISMFMLVNIWGVYGDFKFLRLILAGGVVGFLFSLRLLYIQIFTLEAICFYCLVSFVSSSLLLIISIIFYKNFKQTVNAQ